MDKMQKFLDVEVKAPESEDRTLTFTASTQDRDRDGDVLLVKGWKLEPFMKNPVFLWAHDYRRPPIGRGVSVDNSGDKLKIKVEFVPGDIDPFAEQVYKLFKAGFLRTVSVGFMPTKMEDLTDEDKKQRPEVSYGRRISAELLELSAVPVPANPMAVAQREFQELCVKGLQDLPAGMKGKACGSEMESEKFGEFLKGITHDLTAVAKYLINLRP
jgi:HK97 family phage prohead protease